jgi:predicted O-methyltransferase YrrM
MAYAIIDVVPVVTRTGWLEAHLPAGSLRISIPFDAQRIEVRAAWAESQGPQPLWDGYAAVKNYRMPTAGSIRWPDQVRTKPEMGAFFHWLATVRRPDTIVEFGAAFGVSGMYWLSGLEANQNGRLLSFEPNQAWAAIAEQNLAAVGGRYRLTIGTIEDAIDTVLGKSRIDMAFVDAIHTSDFVLRQFGLLQSRMTPGGLILFDDITFSRDMAEAWDRIARDPVVCASATLNKRVGIVELIL